MLLREITYLMEEDIQQNGILTLKKTTSFGKEWEANIEDDEFIHFTPLSRAKMILNDGILMYEPPFKKFGIAAIAAISTKWGVYVPGVQTTHTKIESGDKMVATYFKTNDKPRIGYAEEVLWDNDVNLVDAKIISDTEAIRMLSANKGIINSDDDIVFYR